MVSSDFGKLEVRRHLISGDDCAMAGEATAVAAAPAAETFKKSRRFIQVSPWVGIFPGISSSGSPSGLLHSPSGLGGWPATLWRGALTRMRQSGNATKA